MTGDPIDADALSLQVEDVKDALARNLSAARSALGMSQEQLAAAAGVSRATVNQLEGGASAKGDPRLSTVVNLATALGVSPIFLILRREELEAITHAPRSLEREAVEAQLRAEQLETIRRLLLSGVAKNRTTAVQMGAEAAATAGVKAGALVAAAIGTAISPGIGTAVGAAIAAGWLAMKNRNEKRAE